MAMVVAYAGMASGIKNTHLLTKKHSRRRRMHTCFHTSYCIDDTSQVQPTQQSWVVAWKALLFPLVVTDDWFLCSLKFSVFFFRFLNEGLKCSCPRGSHVGRHQTSATQNEERLYHQATHLNSRYVTPTPRN